MNTIRPEFVELAPSTLLPGVLYISERFNTALHLCACGCGEKVVTPLSQARWQLTRHGNTVSLHPSIGNWDYACRSHYFIRQNKIVWGGAFSEADIATVKARDRQDVQHEVASRIALKKRSLGERLQDLISGIAKFLHRS